MQLFPSKVHDLDAVNITTKRTNPGREIMKKVVSKRDQINPWNYAHKVNVYIKAKEKIIRKQERSRNDDDLLEDDFEDKDTMNPVSYTHLTLPTKA